MGKTALTWTSSYICPACDLEWETGGHLGDCDEDDCPGCGSRHIYPSESTRGDGHTKKPRPAKDKIKPNPAKTTAPDAFKNLYVERLKKLAEILGEIKQGTFTRNGTTYQFDIIAHRAVSDRPDRPNIIGPAGVAAIHPWFAKKGLGLYRHYGDVLSIFYLSYILKYPLTGQEAIQAFFGLSMRQAGRIFDPSGYRKMGDIAEIKKRLLKAADEISADKDSLEPVNHELWFKPIAAK